MTRRRRRSTSRHNPFSMPQGGLEALETQGPARHPRLPVRHRLQRRGAVARARSATTGPDIMYKAFEIAGYSAGGRRHQFRRHDQRLQVRRAAARRLGAGHRPDRHAARRRAQHPRGRALPDEPARRGPDDERARARSRAKQLRELNIRLVPPAGDGARRIRRRSWLPESDAAARSRRDGDRPLRLRSRRPLRRRL